MKTTIDKCETCGALFEDEKKYTKHIETHQIITILEGAFPKEEDENCSFANGEWNVLRSHSWLKRYKERVVEVVGDIGYPPFSYAWYRVLDDGNSMYYSSACRVMCVCPKCYREWGQPYHANHCNCKDKPKEREESNVN